MKEFISILFLLSVSLIGSDVTAIQNTTLPDTVKIGFLIPDKNSNSALYGAELAVNKANKEGGFKGKPFKLIVRTMDGPWGTGSKQAVNLIFDENVWAIVGSHDGRNAHLVEQVTAKARIVFLSVWSSDPTLSQAFVPWFFSTVPNDLQQADAFIEEIYKKRQISKTAIISDNSYDSNLAVESLLKRITSAGMATPLLVKYENPVNDLNTIIDRIDKGKPGAIILFGLPETSSRLIHALNRKNYPHVVFGALSLLDENYISRQELEYYENAEFISSGNSPESTLFRKDYENRFGKSPGMVAAYSYDGLNCLIKAIRNSGLDRIEIQKSLTKIRLEGATGMIQFDDKGKRIGTPVFMEMKNGILVLPEKN